MNDAVEALLLQVLEQPDAQQDAALRKLGGEPPEPAATPSASEPIRFRTPLPPGHKAPTAPPPPHPGSPPR